MTEQIVSVRVHWLPVYYDNSILWEIFSEFGKVLSVDMLKTAHGEHVTLDGTRQVKMKVDEFKKQTTPHIINFKSGQKLLVTMAGRPPYCLKCKAIGHVRQRCPGMRSYAAAAARNVDDFDESQHSAVPPVAQESPVASFFGPAGPKDVPEPKSGVSDDSGAWRDDNSQQEMDLDPEKGQKRGREGQGSSAGAKSQSETPEHGAWITPNKVAKSGPMPHGTRTPVKAPVPVSNAFSPVMSAEDLMGSS